MSTQQGTVTVIDPKTLVLASALMDRQQMVPRASATTVECQVITPRTAECLPGSIEEEIQSLVVKGAVEKSVSMPAVCSPLQVVSRGGQASLRSGFLSATVARAQFDEMPTHTCIPLSDEEIAKQHAPAREVLTSSYIFAKSPNLDWLGGQRKSALTRVFAFCQNNGLLEVAQALGRRIGLGRAKSTMAAYRNASIRRESWLADAGLPDNPSGVLLYLSDRAEKVGFASLALELAAFKFSHDPPESPTLKLASLIVAGSARSSKKRMTESASEADIKKVIAWFHENDSTKNHRAVVAVLLSWVGLLRASEAVHLTWGDLSAEGDRLELAVRRAKNDQHGKGRSTFVEYRKGGTLHVILQSWKDRQSSVPADDSVVLPNLHNGSRMSVQALGKETKRVLAESGCSKSLTHHALRRGSAQAALQAGVSQEEIQRRGRWRTANGMAPYIRDCVRGQGGLSSLPSGE